MSDYITMSRNVSEEDFPTINHHSGHPDVALAVHVAKHLEHIIRKYFCGDLGNKQLPLGQLIKRHSSIPRDSDPTFTMLLFNLVNKRNSLVHDFETNEFSGPVVKNKFIEESNLALKKLKRLVEESDNDLSLNTEEETVGRVAATCICGVVASVCVAGAAASDVAIHCMIQAFGDDERSVAVHRLINIPFLGHSAASLPLLGLVGLGRGLSIITYTLSFLLFSLLIRSTEFWDTITKLWSLITSILGNLRSRHAPLPPLVPADIPSKKPEKGASIDELIEYRCWQMIKIDPDLQQSIKDDVDGLYEGLLTKPLDYYLSEFDL